MVPAAPSGAWKRPAAMLTTSLSKRRKLGNAMGLSAFSEKNLR